jgi:glycosyltransferase involved in cell wall biosynthesis
MMVTPYVPPYLGGVGTYVLNLAVQLVRQHRIKVVVVAPVTSDVAVSKTEELFAGVDGLHLRWLPAVGKVSNTPGGMGWAHRLQRIACEENIDLVNAHAPAPFVAGIAARSCSELPFVLTYHSGPLRKGKWWIDIGLRGYERWVLANTMRRADALIFASSYARDSFPRAVAPIREIIHPAIDPVLFSPAATPHSPSSVLFVGTLTKATRYKGLATLLHAIGILRTRGFPVALEVVGDGEDLRRYQEMASQLGIDPHVTFSGMLQGQRLVDAYRRNTVVAVPSIVDNFPTVVVEAMACGRPVVASDVGALRDLVIDGQTGFIVPAADPGALADRLADIVCGDDVASRMGREGRRLVSSEATIESQAHRTLNVLERVLHRRNPRTLRLAVVAPHYHPRIGGTEKYAQRVVQALRDSPRHDVVVLTTNESRRMLVESQDGITVVRLPTLLTLSNTPLHPCWPILLRRLFSRLAIDVIHAHAPVPGLADVAAFVAGSRPVVLSYHSGSLLKGVRWIDLFLSLYEKHWLPRVFNRCAALGAVSPVSKCYETGRAVLLPPGVDVTTFSPAPDRQRRDSTVLYVGRIDRTWRMKGLDVLFQSMALLRSEVPEVRLNMVGAGDGVSFLQSLARELGIADIVRWNGALHGKALVEEYRRAGVVVLPSTRPSESFGMVLVEAMACGRPVVGSHIGGIPIVIRPKIDGLLVPPGEPKALADACRSILLDRELAENLGTQGRRIAEERWDWSKRLVPIIDVLDGALKEWPPKNYPVAGPSPHDHVVRHKGSLTLSAIKPIREIGERAQAVYRQT